ncbi:MAG TPA: CAP domain-containing protein [Nannocystaceae bacterium]|nr:CAP domain-containing protein [Nannocystaceae bacterium]
MKPSLPALLLPLWTLSAACAGDDGGDDGTSAGSTSAASQGGTTTSAGGTTAATGETGSTSGGSSAGTSGGTSGGTTGGTTGGSSGSTSGGVVPEGCTAEAGELVALVNAYRAEKGLPAIPASPSLCTVGQTHVVDLQANAPHTEPGCNLHSWSDQGSWTPCCYTPDHAQAMCMWVKPQELTVYPGFGYENAASGVGSPSQALDAWKASGPHNDVILNQGIWADHPWKAIGAGLHEGYAVLWFGEESDPAG